MNQAFGANRDPVHLDTSETVYISGLALLKMLKHGRQGIPLEVVGLMLGSFVDDYTVHVVDVFPTPQSGTGTSVEAIDEPYQSTMNEMLKQVGRKENVVGWYHSHPGFGVWLSSVDLEQQKHWEQLNKRCISVVVDPVKSVRGKVVIGAFRTIDHDPLSQSIPKEPRENTSFIGSSFKVSQDALVHYLNISYYQLNVSYRMSEYEEQMLMSLNRPMWSSGFNLPSFSETEKSTMSVVKGMLDCADSYRHSIIEEEGMTEKEMEIRHVGKVDPQEYMKENSTKLAVSETSRLFRVNLDATTF